MPSKPLADKHFNRLSSQYDRLRALDTEPIEYIVSRLEGGDHRVGDLGCGTGRYLFALLEHLTDDGGKVRSAHGVDPSPGMLEKASEAAVERGLEVQWLHGSSHETGLPSASLSLVTAFNAIHHFSLDTTLPEVARISEPRAMFVVYTRLHEQEADHPWGRHFPDYLDHSINPPRSLMESFGDRDERFELMESRDYTFRREVDVDWVLKQTRSKYYSTLGRYPEEEFNRAFEVFVERLRSECDDANLIRYPSSYSLFLYRVRNT